MRETLETSSGNNFSGLREIILANFCFSLTATAGSHCAFQVACVHRVGPGEEMHLLLIAT